MYCNNRSIDGLEVYHTGTKQEHKIPLHEIKNWSVFAVLVASQSQNVDKLEQFGYVHERADDCDIDMSI